MHLSIAMLLFLPGSIYIKEQKAMGAIYVSKQQASQQDVKLLNFTDSFYNINLQYPSNWTKTYPEQCASDDCIIFEHTAESDELIVSFDIFNDSKKKSDDLVIYGDTLNQLSKNGKATLNAYSDSYLKNDLEHLRFTGHELTNLKENNITIGGHPFWEIEFDDRYRDIITKNKHVLTVENSADSHWFGFKIKYFATDPEEYSKYMPYIREMIKSIKFIEK
jgi:hypothetical protein